MGIIGRWWNRRWSRSARRDIWLTVEPQRWFVRGRQGGDDGPEVQYEFRDEDEARAMVKRLMQAAPGDWRDLTEVMRRRRDRPSTLDAAPRSEDGAGR
jgi:hypothetical protein